MRSLHWASLCRCLSFQAGSVVAWIGTSGLEEEAKGIYRKTVPDLCLSSLDAGSPKLGRWLCCLRGVS